jgi:hypothetical protein
MSHSHEWIDITTVDEQLTIRRYVCSSCTASKLERYSGGSVVESITSSDDACRELLSGLLEPAVAAEPVTAGELTEKDCEQIAEQILERHAGTSHVIVAGEEPPIIASGFVGSWQREPLPRPPVLGTLRRFIRRLPAMISDALDDAKYHAAHEERRRRRERGDDA